MNKISPEQTARLIAEAERRNPGAEPCAGYSSLEECIVLERAVTPALVILYYNEPTTHSTHTVMEEYEDGTDIE